MFSSRSTRIVRGGRAKVTERRAAVDFAGWMRDLVDGPYAGYERLQVVLDNLSTHTPAAFYQAFAPAEARRLLRKLDATTCRSTPAG
jgi:hypothetical protein